MFSVEAGYQAAVDYFAANLGSWFQGAVDQIRENKPLGDVTAKELRTAAQAWDEGMDQRDFLAYLQELIEHLTSAREILEGLDRVLPPDAASWMAPRIITVCGDRLAETVRAGNLRFDCRKHLPAGEQDRFIELLELSLGRMVQ